MTQPAVLIPCGAVFMGAESPRDAGACLTRYRTTPAEAGVQSRNASKDLPASSNWIAAFAGMERGDVRRHSLLVDAMRQRTERRSPAALAGIEEAPAWR